MATGLATRCSACGTVFRVVPDQLRVSEGWVRCGRCTQVFNALEGLVDLDTGQARHGLGAVKSAQAPGGPEAEFEVAHPAARPGAPELPPPPPIPSPVPASPAPEAQPIPESAFEPDTRPAHGELPSFVRSAERAARWRSPAVRLLLLLLALLGAAGLAAQIGYEYRDQLAAQLPQTRPWLEKACAALACKIEAARSIENMAVESSGLVRVEKSNLYRLQVSLRNRAGIELAVPALDLTLTDSQGRLIARKVLRLAELGAPQATIAPGRELNVQATVQTLAASDGSGAVQPIAGYTIDLFYP